MGGWVGGWGCVQQRVTAAPCACADRLLRAGCGTAGALGPGSVVGRERVRSSPALCPYTGTNRVPAENKSVTKAIEGFPKIAFPKCSINWSGTYFDITVYLVKSKCRPST